MYGDIKTRDNRVRTSLLRRRGAGRVVRFILRGLGGGATLYTIADVYGAFAWIASGQPLPESGYYLGKLTVELLKVVMN